jgi:hypothetical protein
MRELLLRFLAPRRMLFCVTNGWTDIADRGLKAAPASTDIYFGSRILPLGAFSYPFSMFIKPGPAHYSRLYARETQALREKVVDRNPIGSHEAFPTGTE